MRRSVRFVTGAIALVFSILVLLFGVAAAIVSTTAGQDLLREQTESVLAAMLGGRYDVELGSQRFVIDSSGDPGVAFSEVTIAESGAQRPIIRAGLVEAGVSLVDLATGSLRLQRLGITDVTVDPALLAALPAASEDLSPKAIFAALDTGFSELSGLQLRSVQVDNVRSSGDGSAIVLERAEMTQKIGGGFAFSAQAVAQGRAIVLDGSARLDASGARLSTFQASAVVDRAETTNFPTESGYDGPLTVDVALQAQAPQRRLGATITAGAATVDGVGEIPLRAASVRVGLAETGRDLLIDAGEVDFGKARATFTGQLALLPDPGGRHPFIFKTVSVTSAVGLPAETPARDGSVTISGSADFAAGEIAIPDIRASVGGGAITGWASASGLGSEDRVRLHLKGSDLDGADVIAFWPFFVAEDARAWMLEHAAPVGAVRQASLDMDITRSRLEAICLPDAQPTDDEVRFTAEVQDLDFATLDGMPDVESADGRIEALGSHVAISFDAAALAGLPTLTVLPSTIDFKHGERPGVDVSMNLNLSGDAGDIAELAQRAPVGGFGGERWSKADVAGTAKIGLGLAVHLPSSSPDPIGGEPTSVDTDLQGDLENWSVVADFRNVDLGKPVSGRRLSDLTGMVMAAPGNAMGELDGKIEGIDARISFSQPILPKGGDPGALTVEATLHDRDLAALSPELAHFVVGPAKVTATRIDDGFHIVGDLTASQLRLPAIGWKKGPGVAATLALDVVGDGSVRSIRNASLSGEGFSASGRGEIDASGLKSLVLDKLAFNRGDRLAARIERGADGTAIAVSGGSVDVRPLLAKLRSGAGDLGSGGDRSNDRITVSVEADRLVGFNDEVLTDAEIAFSGGGGAPSASITAKTGDGRRIRASLGAPGEAGGINVSTEDAGRLLRFAGLYDRMSGGQLRVALQGSARRGYRGPVVLSRFSLNDEPRLASLVGTTRSDRNTLAAAIGDDVKVRNAYFDTAHASLAWKDGRLSVDDGILRGPVFGSSFEGLLYSPAGQIDVSGSFMPAYRINRLFGALPFVGGILGNGGEGGLIGITYRLRGAFTDPTLTVNPVSLIAPGIFRRIFE
ncbi:hypothetical protein [Aurantimonas sp. VKM B-3413]|uniref:hypothetical protein n=1 Tax=Aurantimonas sp. VKM B-3413 TaxID=2779401 RepID=UPI001E5B7282|nr:hypothetical protein [Aurantimonas sp. VKM B-3413]MCB8839863.1 hypothetical protein [Aurantimonas sp. VKM B-3413]